MKASELKQLIELSKLKYDTKQSGFARIVQREHDLRARLSNLRENDTLTSAASQDELLVRAGAALNWARWVEDLRKRLNLELAQVLAQKDMMRRDLQKDFGRVEATRQMFLKQQQAERRAISRKE